MCVWEDGLAVTRGLSLPITHAALALRLPRPEIRHAPQKMVLSAGLHALLFHAENVLHQSTALSLKTSDSRNFPSPNS